MQTALNHPFVQLITTRKNDFGSSDSLISIHSDGREQPPLLVQQRNVHCKALAGYRIAQNILIAYIQSFGLSGVNHTSTALCTSTQVWYRTPIGSLGLLRWPPCRRVAIIYYENAYSSGSSDIAVRPGGALHGGRCRLLHGPNSTRLRFVHSEYYGRTSSSAEPLWQHPIWFWMAERLRSLQPVQCGKCQ